MRLVDTLKREIPDVPGVYFFKRGREILYVGKATSLQSRIRSYFSSDIRTARGPKIVHMITAADSVRWRKTDSVLEALLLESSLIKKYQPYFNTREKDDKSYSFVAITNEEYPRVLTIRGRELDGKRLSSPAAHIFGPFPSNVELRDALRIIRRIFPYRDRCQPMVGKACFNAQIGLCPGVCAGTMSISEYRKQIRSIRLLFEAKKQALVRSLKREMKAAAIKEAFERAAILRKQIAALEHINDIALLKRRDTGVLFSERTQRSPRIEAYDVAHLFGGARVGAMAVVCDNEPLNKEYRKFTLEANLIDDIAGLKEILERRLAHHEWRYPDIIVVDGGIAQKNAAEVLLRKNKQDIPVIAVTKDNNHRPRELKGLKIYRDSHASSILLANAEAHRFAISFHRAKRRCELMGSVDPHKRA
ncbi:MAG: GIY-YIG nuclease family protein [Candidatus Vogelbacteria bacterium]|nr:GIY-YIG nuclease family protein [Candidatus Vogelbacteria bacterium]